MPTAKAKSKRKPADAADRIRRILAEETIEESLRNMSPKYRALYRRIKERREKLGIVVHDTNELIREIREE